MLLTGAELRRPARPARQYNEGVGPGAPPYRPTLELPEAAGLLPDAGAGPSRPTGRLLRGHDQGHKKRSWNEPDPDIIPDSGDDDDEWNPARLPSRNPLLALGQSCERLDREEAGVRDELDTVVISDDDDDAPIPLDSD